MFMSKLCWSMLFGALFLTHACVDIHSETDVHTLIDIDPDLFPDTLEYVALVNGSLTRVLGATYSGRLLQVDYSNVSGAHSLQTIIPWRTQAEFIHECGSHTNPS